MAAERPEKKEKKEKKRSDEAGVSKSKKDKKAKKEKKDKLAAAVESHLQQDAAAQSEKPAAGDDAASDMDEDKRSEPALETTVVSFALPVADEKGMKKVYKTIRKAAKNGTLKRGVKEVVKALRKSPPSAPGYTSFPGVVVIAGDISPHDVISHIPVLCEDHNVPFIFVTSRAELGASAKTKRPTSVVMLMEKHEPGKKKPAPKEAADKEGDGDGDGEAYAEAYAALAKYMHKEYARQGFWAKGDSKSVL